MKDINFRVQGSKAKVNLCFRFEPRGRCTDLHSGVSAKKTAEAVHFGRHWELRENV